MKIEKVRLSVITMPLKTPFKTHLETVKEREAIIVEAISSDGVSGFGEAVAFTTPWYTEETVKTCLHMLKEILIPIIQNKEIEHPSIVSKWFEPIRRNMMAKASLEMAIWDAFAKHERMPLWKLIGGDREEVLAGAVVGTSSVHEMLAQTAKLVEEGYKRIKIKISPQNDIEFLQALRNKYPHLSIMADANSAYNLGDVGELQKLDKFNLLMIEQPLAVDDIVEHSLIQKQVNTPICLDESIVTVQDLKNAIHLESLNVLNIKLGRVGGYAHALEMYKLCQKHNIQVWCGGMIEFGVSRAHNISLATLDGFSIPGDLSSSSRYWKEDIIEPEVHVVNGKIKRHNGHGIGFEVNRERLERVTVLQEIIK